MTRSKKEELIICWDEYANQLLKGEWKYFTESPAIAHDKTDELCRGKTGKERVDAVYEFLRPQLNKLGSLISMLSETKTSMSVECVDREADNCQKFCTAARQSIFTFLRDYSQELLSKQRADQSEHWFYDFHARILLEQFFAKFQNLANEWKLFVVRLLRHLRVADAAADSIAGSGNKLAP
ncbi:hypothetical protein SJAG_02365 [Schizosaccharomyces japonicus yFS275]|uniref:Uncharacterized protein n=1 Tax=Schizosaccharomyces japonicus (strain yFS275 / FY16936) TaxID=402676 RepID=B6K297_SCHJY|nr:hypothetical protein SJAG_02365 [Schizosaccharomyces japonicus yFS275]EEB07278.1 hypothetical protein SJAG_02365 [Schizosaccharomyces japonicus yFS275]